LSIFGPLDAATYAADEALARILAQKLTEAGGILV
jgi:hypothetical protein